MKYHEEIILLNKAFLFILGAAVIAGLWMIAADISDNGWIVMVALLFPLLFGRMVITVEDSTLKINFGYIDLIKKEIPLSEIKEIRVLEYSPIRQFGGWGIRCGKFEGEKTACYNLKGNRGLLLTLSNKIRICCMKTDRVIVGCEGADALKEAIKNG